VLDTDGKTPLRLAAGARSEKRKGTSMNGAAQKRLIDPMKDMK